MANAYPTSLNNYTGSETLNAAGHASAHNAYEAKIGTGASTPTSNKVLRGSGTGTSSWAQVVLTTDVSGTLPVGNGGTGATTFTSGNVLVGAGASAVTASKAAPTGSFVGTTDSQTLTNKTLTAPIISTISNTGTLTLPTATDTLVGRATTDTLTNKTLTSPALQGNVDGWIADTNTWTYSSADGATGVLTINADLTAVIQAGDRIKLTQTTPKYFIVSKTPTFGAGSTTLTFWGGTDYTLANAAITSPAYSHAKSPFGFNPDPTKWTIRVTDTTDRSQASPGAATWYNLGTTAEQITLMIGEWDVYYSVTPQLDYAAATGVFVTLSTANNSESDAELTCNQQSQAAFSTGSVSKRKTLTVAAKTIYYLNSKTTTGAATTLYNRNSANGAALVIEARCAYL